MSSFFAGSCVPQSKYSSDRSSTGSRHTFCSRFCPTAPSWWRRTRGWRSTTQSCEPSSSQQNSKRLPRSIISFNTWRLPQVELKLMVSFQSSSHSNFSFYAPEATGHQLVEWFLCPLELVALPKMDNCSLQPPVGAIIWPCSLASTQHRNPNPWPAASGVP